MRFLIIVTVLSVLFSACGSYPFLKEEELKNFCDYLGGEHRIIYFKKTYELKPNGRQIETIHFLLSIGKNVNTLDAQYFYFTTGSQKELLSYHACIRKKDVIFKKI